MATTKVIVNGQVRYVDEAGNYVSAPKTGIAALDNSTAGGTGPDIGIEEPTFMQSLNANAPAVNAGVGAFNAGLGFMSYLDKKPVYKMQTALMGQQLEQNIQSAANRETFNKNWGKGLASSAVSAPRVG